MEQDPMNNRPTEKKKRRLWFIPIVAFALVAVVAAIIVTVVSIRNSMDAKKYRDEIAKQTQAESVTSDMKELETGEENESEETTKPLATRDDTSLEQEGETLSESVEDMTTQDEQESLQPDATADATKPSDNGSKEDSSKENSSKEEPSKENPSKENPSKENTTKPSSDENPGKQENASFNKRGKLSLSGTKLVDKNGKPIQLKGVSTHGLQWFPQYVNKDAFQTLRDDWGANLVRLALYTHEGGYCSGGDQASLEATLDKGVKAATELGMYVIIDWHVLNENNPKRYQDDAVKFFDKMAKKYASYDNVLYEICNEPNNTSWSDIKSYADTVIPVIRKHDSDAIIILGTECWSQLQNLDSMLSNPIKKENQKNVMYTCHFYAATHHDNIRNNVTRALDNGLPVFVSEFSICDASGNGGIDYDSANKWKKLINENNLSYAGWSLCNKAETSALISSSSSKLSGWSVSELSDTGRWLREMIGSSSGNSSGTEKPTKKDESEKVTEPTTTQNTSGDTFKITKKKSTKNCDFTFSLENSWRENGSYCYVVQAYVINNSSSNLPNWELELNVPKGTEVREGAWGCKAGISGSKLNIQGSDYTLNIASGSKNNFGFIVASPSALKF